MLCLDFLIEEEDKEGENLTRSAQQSAPLMSHSGAAAQTQPNFSDISFLCK